jgi:hypothetical protein
MTEEIKYPYFVRTPDKITDNFFVQSYMSFEDVARIKKLFPHGCRTDLGIFTIKYNGVCIDDLRGEARLYALDREHELEKRYQWHKYAYNDLIHNDYQVLWWIDGDNNPLIAVVKGRVKPNKNTQYKLLKKVPEKVQQVWDAVWQSYGVLVQLAIKDVLEKYGAESCQK